MAFLCERKPCKRALKTVTIASKSLTSSSSGEKDSPLMTVIFVPWRSQKSLCASITFPLTFSDSAYLLTSVGVVLLTWHPPLFAYMQIDPRFLLTPVERVLAQSRPFVHRLLQMFLEPIRKAESVAPDRVFPPKRGWCSSSILAHAARINPDARRI